MLSPQGEFELVILHGVSGKPERKYKGRRVAEMKETIVRANALFSKDRRVYAIHGKGADVSGVRGVGIGVEWPGMGKTRRDD
jgi:hypothetical protein